MAGYGLGGFGIDGSGGSLADKNRAKACEV